MPVLGARGAVIEFHDPKHLWGAFKKFSEIYMPDSITVEWNNGQRFARFHGPDAMSLVVQLLDHWALSLKLMRAWKKTDGITPGKVGGNAACLRRETEFLLGAASASHPVSYL